MAFEEGAGLVQARSPLLDKGREDGARVRRVYHSEEGRSNEEDIELDPQQKLFIPLDFYVLFFGVFLREYQICSSGSNRLWLPASGTGLMCLLFPPSAIEITLRRSS